MSFMGGGGTPAAASPASAGRVNTYREAEAVPFLVGTARIAPKWISDRFNDQWSNGKMTGQAYCSIVGVLCHGPLDKVSVMYQGGEALWTLNLTRTAGQDYASFSFGGPDTQLGPTYVGRIYWGTETQTADAWLVAKSGQDHPPYRGMAYVVFERLHCGQVQANSQAQPAVPNVEFLCTRLPSPHLPEALRLPATLDADFWRGANFVSALYDVLTHPRAGLDCADYLDTASFIAAAQGIEAGTKRLYGLDAEYARVSVLLTGGSDAESVLGDFLAHADGFASANNGLISLDWFPNDGSTPTGLPTLTQHDLSKHPEIDLSLLDDVPTSVAVTCLDYWADLAESVETCNVPFTKQGRGDSSPQKLSRPWITERFVAAQYAARHAALAATPAAGGKLSVLIHRAVRADGSPLRPGDRFLLNYEPDALLFICRVTEIEEPDGADAVVDLSFIREHGTSALPYVPEVDPRADYELPEPATPGADDWVVMETPPELGGGKVVALIRRPQNTLAGAELEMDDDNNWAAGTSLLGRQGFAAHGTLTADITSAAGTLTLYGTGIDLGPTLASGMSAGQQADNTLLAYIGGEWLSVGTVTSVATDTYQLALLRGRLGSTAAAHTTGSAVWIIARAELTQFTHALFTSESTRYFKAACYHALQTGTPSAAKSATFRAVTPVRRTVTLYQYFAGATAPLAIDYWIDLGESPGGGMGGWIGHWPGDEAWSPWKLHNVEGYFRWYLTPPPPTIEGGPNVATKTDGSRWALWSCSCEVLDSDGDTIVEGSFTTPERVVVGLSTAKAAINEGAVRLAEVKPSNDSAGWSPPIYHSATGKFQIRKNATTDTLEWTPDGGTTVHAMGGGGGTTLPTPTLGQMLYCAEAGVWAALPAPTTAGQRLIAATVGADIAPHWALPAAGVETDPSDALIAGAGPVAWYRADYGVEEAAGDAAEDTDGVARWLDQSGNGNHLEQSTSALRPVYRTAQRGALPVVRFDGAGDYLRCAGFSGFNLQNCTVIWVGACATAAEYQRMLVIGASGTGHDYNSANRLELECGDGARHYMAQCNSAQSLLDGSRPAPGGVYHARMSRSLLLAGVNDAAFGTAVSATASTSVAGLLIGAAWYNGGIGTSWGQLAGDVCEVVVYPRALGNVDLGNIVTALRAKWGY